MDPTLSKGVQVKPQKNDIVALGLAGWDVDQGPCDGISYGDCNNDGHPFSIADMVYMLRYLRGDAPHYNNLCSYELNHYDNPFFPCEPTFGDYLFFSLYYGSILFYNDINPECKYTIFSESYGLNIVMPSNVDILANSDPMGIFSETFTIQLENNNISPMYVWSLTVPVHFPVSGGTGDVLYVFQNHQNYGKWTVIDPINPSGTRAVQFISSSSPVMVPGLSTIDLFDVWYSYFTWTGHPIMNAEFFTEVPARFPVATISTTPTPAGSRQPHQLMEVTLGSTHVPFGCDCEPGEADGVSPTNILDIVYLINYKYKSGPIPCDCNTWLGICGPPLRK
jgi:hypothetical protein